MLGSQIEELLESEMEANGDFAIITDKAIVQKGQLISKANFEVFIWTKKQTKIFLYFCPSLWKWSNQENI